MKYQCLVLCLKAFIPRVAPSAPPKNAVMKILRSGIRRIFFFARFLSIPIKANPRRFIKPKYNKIYLIIIIFLPVLYIYVPLCYNPMDIRKKV